AWDIYWVMQLDSIGVLLFLIALVSGIATLVLLVWAAMHAEEDRYSWNEGKTEERIAFRVQLLRWAKQAGGVSAVMIIAASVVPSTKTAAAMIVLPAVANSETVQREAGELYGIAKDALRELAKPDAVKPDAPEAELIPGRDDLEESNR